MNIAHRIEKHHVNPVQREPTWINLIDKDTVNVTQSKCHLQKSQVLQTHSPNEPIKMFLFCYSSCESTGRPLIKPGTRSTDSTCGDCPSGEYYDWYLGSCCSRCPAGKNYIVLL